MRAENPMASSSISVSVGEQLAAVAERLRRCTVEIRGEGEGRGSGVVWQADGLIVTNAHVAGTSRQTVKLFDGRWFRAELVGRDPRYDLAWLRIHGSGLAAVAVRDASHVARRRAGAGDRQSD